MDLSFLGTWGLAVLIASMSGTQAVKKVLKKRGAGNIYLFSALPVLFSTIGIVAMAIGDLVPWKMAPIYIFILGLGGNAFYKMWRARA